jgi:autotransporter family porin
MTLKPYLLANVWRTFSGSDTTTFNATPIATGFGYTSLELGGGVAAQVAPRVGVYAAASYTSNLGGDHRRGIRGNLGLRVTW